jgi:lipopolysaccharide export system permease protein
VKILDKYLLKSFLITFTTVFVILFFIFILQTVWLFISELAGKDLDFLLILKFLLFAMPRIVPMVLPLSVVLASIMTFGNLAENYEFAAMKSAGISLQRAMRSTFFFIILLSLIAFIFANNVIPYAEYKFINFRRNIAQRTPAMAIAEGQFSEVGNYTIKVAKKSGEKGNLLSEVIIHIKSSTGDGNKTVIKAKRGELISSETSNNLQLVLFDGYYYEDLKPTNFEERSRLPFAKATFKKDIINIDLSKLNTNVDNGEIANTNTMLNINELRYTLDSLNTNYTKDITSYTENIYQRIYVNSMYGSGTTAQTTTDATKQFNANNILEGVDKLKQGQVYKIAAGAVESTSFTIDSSKFDLEEKQKNINSHWIALFDKFVIAFACILMFFIGAPLGSIIRKGGLGLPIVLAVAIFIVFHFINTFGKKVAQENGISPFMGTWLSSMVLSPLAVLLTYRATNDIGGMISIDAITTPLLQWFKKLPFINKKETLDKKIIENVPLKVTDTNSEKSDTFQIISKIKRYNVIGFVFYIVAIVLCNALLNNFQMNLVALLAVALIVIYTTIFITHKNIGKLEKVTGTSYQESLIIELLLGFPLFILGYLQTHFTLKAILKSTT